MSFKLFGQLIIIGGQVVGKIVSSAYKQALQNVAKGSEAAASKTNNASKTVSGMSLDEAAKILNVPPTSPREEMIKKYEHLFKVNDRRTGGSFYLQSKVVRAREAFEQQYSNKQ